jgi:hypothetical protein
MTANSPKQPVEAPLSPLHEKVYAQLAMQLAQPKSAQNLEQMMRLLAKWRSMLLANTIIAKDGMTVQAGPFAGMRYLAAGSEGSTAARLLGSYESALHPIIDKIIRRGYGLIIDVGCAEGYYAVGLARLMPQARVMAHDQNPVAQQKCAELARLNGVELQVQIGGEIGPADFDICAHAKTLVICDIEGAEAQLLDPARAKGLLSADILVEVHDCFVPGLSAQISQRFADTHNVQLIHRAHSAQPLPAWMETLSDLDRLIALWEWRIGPTPWLWMTRKGRSAEALAKPARKNKR